VLHGFPFAIAGVACACGIANVSTANVKKTNVTAPTKPLMIVYERHAAAARRTSRTHKNSRQLTGGHRHTQPNKQTEALTPSFPIEKQNL